MTDKLDEWLTQNLQKGAEQGKIVGEQPLKKPFEKKKIFPQKVFKKPFSKDVVRVIPLGGLDEVGKNMMVFECGEDIIIVDMGFQFPDEDMLGVDYVIPDVSYLDDKKHRIKGVLITHGHLDHIGGIPYLMPRLNFPPIYGTKLTMGLVQKRLEEFGLQHQSKLRVFNPDDRLRFGCFDVSFFRVNHSIPDAVGIIIRTPAGVMVHTGDFKFDFTPAGDQKPAEFHKIAALGNQNVVALFSDSTNALKTGHTISEKDVGKTLEEIIKNTEDRIIIASFSSLIGRIQQIINFAQKYGRKIFLSGRSMVDNVFIAEKLGYLKFPRELIYDIKKVQKIPEHHALILTTGSQGEDVSALTRISFQDHPNIHIRKGDTVVISSTPIVGNERAIATVINNLCRLGAHVIHSRIMDVHTSGHANQEDLKLMMNLVKPKSLVPIHGEYFMRRGHGDVAKSVGFKDEQIIMIENGDVIEFREGRAYLPGPKAKVQTNYIVIDGLGVGDVGAQTILDRQIMAENGILITLIPIDVKTRKIKGSIDIISRGFIYLKETEKIINEVAKEASDAYSKIISKRPDAKRGEIKKFIRETLDKHIHRKLDRHPLILPVIVEI